MSQDGNDELLGTVLAAMSMSQLALSEVMNISAEVKEKIAKTAQQMIDFNRRRDPAHAIAANLMQTWLDLNMAPKKPS